MSSYEDPDAPKDFSAWLASLKVGDKVAVQDRIIGESYSRRYGYRIYTIKHITPSRARFDLVKELSADGSVAPLKLSFGKRGDARLEHLHYSVRMVYPSARIFERIEHEGWQVKFYNLAVNTESLAHKAQEWFTQATAEELSQVVTRGKEFYSNLAALQSKYGKKGE